MDPKIDLKMILDLNAKWIRGEAGESRADLRWANLRGADLTGADLTGADLAGADLRGADLTGASLSRANLRGASLRGASLTRADLTRANLKDCKGAELALAMASHLPEGPFCGWKKCRNGVIVKLLIPAEARRSHGAERKCRAEFVKVLEVYGADGISRRGLVGISLYDDKTEYRKGKIVKPDGWDEDRWNTCGQGIHFYLTRIEAENHL